MSIVFLLSVFPLLYTTKTEKKAERRLTLCKVSESIFLFFLLFSLQNIEDIVMKVYLFDICAKFFGFQFESRYISVF